MIAMPLALVSVTVVTAVTAVAVVAVVPATRPLRHNRHTFTRRQSQHPLYFSQNVLAVRILFQLEQLRLNAI